MSYIPDNQWECFCEKVGQVANSCDLNKRRHWEKLHDVFNEAVGAKLLAARYRCRTVELLRQAKSKRQSVMPDWVGHSVTRTTYVEVKTVNHSDIERLSWYSGPQPIHLVELPPALKRKIQSTYSEAIHQLNIIPINNRTRTVVAMVLNPDYNIDPIKHSIEHVISEYLNEIELREFPIIFHVQRT